MGNCSLEVLMNNGGKAACGGVQTPSPSGMIFSPPQEFWESFLGHWRLKEPQTASPHHSELGEQLQGAVALWGCSLQEGRDSRDAPVEFQLREGGGLARLPREATETTQGPRSLNLSASAAAPWKVTGMVTFYWAAPLCLSVRDF